MTYGEDMKAHELISRLNPKSEDYKNCVIADKFDLGEISDVHYLAKIGNGDFLEIPSPVCLFQMSVEGHVACMALAIDKIDHVQWSVFTRNTQDQYLWRGISQSVHITKTGNVSVFDLAGNEIELVGEWGESLPEHRAWMIYQVIKIALAVEVFSCSNVKTIEHLPQEKLNLKRLKSGKTPFYSYKTLHIGDRVGYSGGPAAIGGHASPRLHLRRGHIRKLASGLKVWVSSCLVGDKSRGMVKKDYKLNPAYNQPQSNTGE